MSRSYHRSAATDRRAAAHLPCSVPPRCASHDVPLSQSATPTPLAPPSCSVEKAKAIALHLPDVVGTRSKKQIYQNGGA